MDVLKNILPKKSPLQCSIQKATTSSANNPKDRFVKQIVSASRDGNSEEVVRSLGRRMEKPHYCVVLKCLMIIHRIFKDSIITYYSADFIKYLSSGDFETYFSLSHFLTVAPPNDITTHFLKRYSVYLQEKVSVVKKLGIINFFFPEH